MQFLTGVLPNMTLGLSPSKKIPGATQKEFVDFLTNCYFTITPGNIKSLFKTQAIHGFSAYWWLDQYNPALQTDCTVTAIKCTFLSYILILPHEGNSNCH